MNKELVKGLEPIVDMEYGGRLIIIGRDSKGENNIILYGLTGRTSGSQARRLEFKMDRNIHTVPLESEEDIKAKGQDPALLIYPVIMYCADENELYGIAVSNGKQTTSIADSIKKEKDKKPFVVDNVIVNSLNNWSYESDKPNFTPRIGGALIKAGDDYQAGMNIVKKGEDGDEEKHYHIFDLENRKGKMIATYTGVNENPLPSFKGELIDVELKGKEPEEMAYMLWEALGPKNKKDEFTEKDFRVGVACVFQKIKEDTLVSQHWNINRHDRVKK